MLYDLTLKITPELMKDANNNEKITLSGHMGTHFDVMDKEFPLEYLHLPAIIFDISKIRNRDIEVSDINLDLVKEKMFVAFFTGYLNETGYGTIDYFKKHVQLSHELIEQLLNKNIYIIGIDCAGIRRGQEHKQADQNCANNNTFVIENLCNLDKVLNNNKYVHCTINTYPINYTNMSGLPSRVIAIK